MDYLTAAFQTQSDREVSARRAAIIELQLHQSSDGDGGQDFRDCYDTRY